MFAEISGNLNCIHVYVEHTLFLKLYIGMQGGIVPHCLFGASISDTRQVGINLLISIIQGRHKGIQAMDISRMQGHISELFQTL